MVEEGLELWETCNRPGIGFEWANILLPDSTTLGKCLHFSKGHRAKDALPMQDRKEQDGRDSRLPGECGGAG